MKNNELYIVHFSTDKNIDEQKILTNDPLVIFHDSTDGYKVTQVKVLPFVDTEKEKESLPFEQKMRWFKKIILPRRGKSEVKVLVDGDNANSAVVSHIDISNLDLGTFIEFENAINNPKNIGVDYTSFFDKFLDLEADSYTLFETGLGETYNG